MRESLKNCFASAAATRRNVEPAHNLSVRTVRRRLRQQGLKACRPCKKSFINAYQGLRRVHFAQRYLQKGMDFWNRVTPKI